MSVEKWKEIERNLAEQESFVQSIMEQREKKSKQENSSNAENILASSIQRAKEKISLVDSKTQPPRHDRSFDNTGTSREKKEKGLEEGSAIAAAMKKLQDRITSLENENKRLEEQSKESRRREMIEQENNHSLTQSLEENKRKIKSFETSINRDKQTIKELERVNEELESRLSAHKKDENDSDLESKLTSSQMMFKAQEQEMKNLVHENQSKERKLMEVENKRREEEMRYGEEISLLKSVTKEMELKMERCQEKIKEKDTIIENLKNAMNNFDSEKLKSSSYHTLKPNTEFEESLQNESRNEKRRTYQQTQENEELRENYEELFDEYKNLDIKFRNEKGEAKNYRTKFWQLKEAVKELVEKITTLPNGVTSQLRYLIVKINKIEASPNDYFAATPSKSGRKSSLLNTPTRSKSKSQSKKKEIKIDLNRSSNSAKSKRSTNTNRSTESKKSIKSKEKHVIVSQKNCKRTEIMMIESEIQEIRKRYKELAAAQGRGSDVSEDTREELNNLAILLQEKSEQVTKLKRMK